MKTIKSIKTGFTLIELLVVIAIIALLLGILIPSLNAAKKIASGAVCLANENGLCNAWTIYHQEYKSYLVGGSNYFNGTRGTPYRWAEPPLNNEKDNVEVTGIASVMSFETRKNGIRAGKLWPYTQDEKLYHCPGDKTFAKNAEPYAAYRSYAIAGLMNGEDFIDRQSASIYSPIKTYRVVGTRTLYCVTKFNEIKAPGSKYVFVEEKYGGVGGQQYNAGGFVLMANNNPDSWWDYPAEYHNDQSTVGFADGHAETHKWHNSDTLKMILAPSRTEASVYFVSPNNEDLKWMIQGYFPR